MSREKAAKRKLMHTRQKLQKWFGPVAMLLVAAIVGAGVPGCGGGNSGLSVLPTPTVTARPGVTPTAVPTAQPGIATVFTANGTFNRSTGQFTQDADTPGSPGGAFFRVRVVNAPGPTPGPTPTAVPQPTSNNPLSYVGKYRLSNGETGLFYLGVDQPGAARPAQALGAPGVAEGKAFDFDRPVEAGRATVTVRVSGSTGSGRVTLSNGLTGTITIDERIANSIHTLRSLPQNVRVKMMLTGKNR
jgi:hypothetical protein